MIMTAGNMIKVTYIALVLVFETRYTGYARAYPDLVFSHHHKHMNMHTHFPSTVCLHLKAIIHLKYFLYVKSTL